MGTYTTNFNLYKPAKNDVDYVAPFAASMDTIDTELAKVPAGSDTHVQLNDGGVLGADAGMTYNKTADTLTVLGGHLGQTGTGATKSSVFGSHLKGGSLAAGANTGAQSTVDAGNNGGVVIVVLNMVTADKLSHVFDISIQAHGQNYNLQTATLLNQLTDGSLVLSHTSGSFSFTFTNNSAQAAYWQVRVLPLVDLYSTLGGY